MSNSLKQDVINVVGEDRYIQRCNEIAQLYDDAERGICSNMQIDTTEELSLYNVQFIIEKYGKIINKFGKIINKFVYALNEQDAKEIVFKYYKHYKFDKSDVYCKKVDIKRGMMFNV